MFHKTNWRHHHFPMVSPNPLPASSFPPLWRQSPRLRTQRPSAGFAFWGYILGEVHQQNPISCTILWGSLAITSCFYGVSVCFFLGNSSIGGLVSSPHNWGVFLSAGENPLKRDIIIGMVDDRDWHRVYDITWNLWIHSIQAHTSTCISCLSPI